MSSTETITLASLYELTDHLREGKWHHKPKKEIDVRLRPATIAFFEFKWIEKVGRGYELGFGKCRNNPRYSNGVYLPSPPGALVDVCGLEVPDEHRVAVRGVWDMYISNLSAARPPEAP